MRILVESAQDDRLGDYVRLRDASLRRHLEATHGLFIAEGSKVIRRAIDAGYQPRSFLLAERWLADLADLLDGWPDTPVFVVAEAVAEEVTGFHVHRGALASLRREQRHTTRDLLRLQRLVVIEDVVDHTNVGAILRNAAALGWAGVLLAPRAADPLYRRSIKVSMGAVFSLPWARLDDWASAPQRLREAGFFTVAMGLIPEAVPIETVRDQVIRDRRRVAVLVGTEGAGLSAHWSSSADVVATIAMHRGIDSLNVAAASALACYVLRG